MIIPYIYLKYILYTVLFVGLPIATLIILKLIQKLTLGKCTSLVCLTGKTAIVTGAASGIGYETALHLASRGCRVIIADKEGGAKAKTKIIQTTNNNNVRVKYLDLASLKSVRQFAKDINETEERLDILINNAGVVTVGNKHTDDGLHETMQINHFGPFLLTHLLVDLLKKSAPSRIIFVSSGFSFFSNLSIENLNYPRDHPLSLFRTSLIYGNSKLCNIIAANGFAERLEDFGVTCNSLHPGWVNTKIIKNAEEWTGLDGLEHVVLSPLSFMYAKTAREGAQTTLHLALANNVQEITGKHFWDCVTFPLPPGARNEKFCKDIWEESEIFVKLTANERIFKKENVVIFDEIPKIVKTTIEETTANDEDLLDETEELIDNEINSDQEKCKNTDEIKIDELCSSGEATLLVQECENGDEADDEKEENPNDDEVDESSNVKHSIDCFPHFRKSKTGENFITMNGAAEYNKTKERS